MESFGAMKINVFWCQYPLVNNYGSASLSKLKKSDCRKTADLFYIAVLFLSAKGGLTLTAFRDFKPLQSKINTFPYPQSLPNTPQYTVQLCIASALKHQNSTDIAPK
jgi:hypothetical protein